MLHPRPAPSLSTAVCKGFFIGFATPFLQHLIVLWGFYECVGWRLEWFRAKWTSWALEDHHTWILLVMTCSCNINHGCTVFNGVFWYPLNRGPKMPIKPYKPPSSLIKVKENPSNFPPTNRDQPNFKDLTRHFCRHASAEKFKRAMRRFRWGYKLQRGFQGSLWGKGLKPITVSKLSLSLPLSLCLSRSLSVSLSQSLGLGINPSSETLR